MIELPEALTLAGQLKAVSAKKIRRIFPPQRAHKFCWFSLDPTEYERQLKGASLSNSEGFGSYVELSFDNGKKLCINDGVNLRYSSSADDWKNYQLLMEFDDQTALVFTVAMYGGIFLYNDELNSDYYQKSKSFVSPFISDFKLYFYDILSRCKVSTSAKAFLATQQRFPGIGNGVLQDILFEANVNPKQAVGLLKDTEIERLLHSTISVLTKMKELGGRDTEKDLFGNNGGYITKMSKNTLGGGCPVCGSTIIKEAYMGGSVYYCSHCQPLIKV